LVEINQTQLRTFAREAVRNGFAGAITRSLTAGAGDNGNVSAEPIIKFLGFRDGSSPVYMNKILASDVAVFIVAWRLKKL
jgi:hypothetical protein